MRIEVKGRNFQVTEDLKGHVEKRFQKVARQVSAGALTSEPLTGKNTSVGLRATCTIQFTAAQTAISRTVPTTIRTANVATRKARTARRASRQAAAEGCARRHRVLVFRGAPREIVA